MDNAPAVVRPREKEQPAVAAGATAHILRVDHNLAVCAVPRKTEAGITPGAASIELGRGEQAIVFDEPDPGIGKRRKRVACLVPLLEGTGQFLLNSGRKVYPESALINLHAGPELSEILARKARTGLIPWLGADRHRIAHHDEDGRVDLAQRLHFSASPRMVEWANTVASTRLSSSSVLDDSRTAPCEPPQLLAAARRNRRAAGRIVREPSTQTCGLSGDYAANSLRTAA